MVGSMKLWSGRQDSNLRPSGPKPDALPPAPLPEGGKGMKFQFKNAKQYTFELKTIEFKRKGVVKKI